MANKIEINLLFKGYIGLLVYFGFYLLRKAIGKYQ
jgi:hypothetical protein